jgi:hypothetical protein
MTPGHGKHPARTAGCSGCRTVITLLQVAETATSLSSLASTPRWIGVAPQECNFAGLSQHVRESVLIETQQRLEGVGLQVEARVATAMGRVPAPCSARDGSLLSGLYRVSEGGSAEGLRQPDARLPPLQF